MELVCFDFGVLTRYLDMPAEFVHECLTPEGGWIDWGLYRAEDFVRGEDGHYVAQVRKLWAARCGSGVRQDGSVIYVIDGAGDPYTYRLIPFPSEQYPGRT